MVYAMILLGGITRLTDSGLSITEWDPIMGALPPLSDAAWQEVFDKYKTTDEYQMQNSGMSLSEFRQIFWPEWLHRNLGRLIGLVVVIPFGVFWYRGMTTPLIRRRVAVIFLLGALQGFVGWWMVASGLSGRVDVAPYRLAVHFGLALAIFAAIFWLWADLRAASKPHFYSEKAKSWARWLCMLVALQMLLGALVAGLDAGRNYTDWPLMGGEFIPSGYADMAPFWINAFENAATTQFNHRIAAYLLLILSILAIYRVESPERKPFIALAHLLLAQMALGIVTVMMAAPLWAGLLHQALGVVVWLASVRVFRLSFH